MRLTALVMGALAAVSSTVVTGHKCIHEEIQAKADVYVAPETDFDRALPERRRAMLAAGIGPRSAFLAGNNADLAGGAAAATAAADDNAEATDDNAEATAAGGFGRSFEVRAYGDGFQPLRITLDDSRLADNADPATTYCSSCTSGLTPAKRSHLLGTVMVRAVDFLTRALRVERQPGLLKLGKSSCYEATGIGAPYTTTGVSADYMIFLTARPTQGSTIAWAAYCATLANGRPYAAHGASIFHIIVYFRWRWEAFVFFFFFFFFFFFCVTLAFFAFLFFSLSFLLFFFSPGSFSCVYYIFLIRLYCTH
jgi:hypothetical protein